MREIKASDITKLVQRLFVEANYTLPPDLAGLIEDASQNEPDPLGKQILCRLCENLKAAKVYNVPICQDTGLAVVFVELGQDVHITGGNFEEAINAGVRAAYLGGYLRCSVVGDPLFSRKNTNDNTPAVIHTEIVPGDKLKLILLPKGGGSENMGQLKMLVPSQGLQGVKDFVLQCVTSAGGNPCPPIIVGIGVGGTMDKATLLAKKALLRRIGEPNPDPRYAQLEKELFFEINATGIGPQGLGGRITALAVHIEYFPTHITQLPVAVNLNCHAARRAEAVL